jgi:hypothetical protein
VLQKLRDKPTLNPATLITVVKSVIGSDKDVELLERFSPDRIWRIGRSKLGHTTTFGGLGRLHITGPDACDADPLDHGLTTGQWLEVRQDAYEYEIRIYAYTPSADELAELDRQLTIAERSTTRHVILSGLSH